MKFSIKLLILYQLVINSALADIVTTPIRSMPPNPEGHNKPVNSIAISPDGHYALSGSSDGTMKMWELSSGAEIRSFVGHSDTKNSIGQAIIIAAGGAQPSNSVFEYSNEYTQRFYRLLKERGYKDEEIAYMNPQAPDIDLDGYQEYELHDYNLLDPEKELTTAFQQAAQNPGKQFIFYLHGHAQPDRFRITENYELSANHLKTLLAMIPSNIEQIIIMATVYAGSFFDELKQPGRILISSTDSTSRVWNVKYSSFSDTFLTYLRRGMSLMEAFKQAENMIIEEKQLFGEQRPWIDDNGDGVYDNTDGEQARQIQIVKEFSKIEPSVLRSIDISPDGSYGLSGSFDKTMKLWELSNGAEIRSFVGHTDYVFSVSISPDGRYALSGSADKTMKLWELSNGSEIRNFAGHTDGIYSVTLSPDGRYALSGSADKTMKLWELSTGAEIRSFIGHNSEIMSVAISADGRYALSGSSDAAMKLWELSTGAEVRSFIGHTSSVNSVAFSSDNRYALSGSSDKTMKLWDISTGLEIRRFEGHTESITSVAFSPDGRYVYSGSLDKTIKMWDSGKPKGLGQAIIIAAGGGQKGNSLYKFSNEYTQRFYRILKERGYKDEQIAYINPQAPDLNEDGYLENKLLDYQLFNPEQELTTAFQQAAQNYGEQFIFYLHGHARPEHFRIKPDYELSASHLQTLLAQIPSSIPQILILDSCYSGSFFNKLKQPGRILISSADNQSLAWSDKNGSFADNFLFNLRRGFNLSEAFNDTKQMIDQEKELFGDQNPWLDDDGDGQSTTRDGILAAKIKIGNKEVHGAPPPTIQVHPRIELPENVTEATLWVKTTPSVDGIKKVRAIIINPEFSVGEYKGLETDFGREELELIYNPAQDRYEIPYQGFTIPGKWSILYQAVSKEIVWSETIKGTVQAKGMTKAATIKMQLNENRYKITEPLQLAAEINGQAQIDLYIALILPNGQFITFQYPSLSSWPNVAEIYKAGIKIEQKTSISIPLKLPNGATLGQYQACGVLVKANAEPLKQENWIDINCQGFEVY